MPEPPLAGDDIATMLGSLERQRATFAWKCAGVGDPDWEWHAATRHTPEVLLRRWQGAVRRSRAVLDDLLADGDLDQLARVTPSCCGLMAR